MAQQKQENDFEGWANEVDIDKLRAQSKMSHDWKQRGPMLVCEKCTNRHETYVGMHLQLVGVENGQPVLEKR